MKFMNAEDAESHAEKKRILAKGSSGTKMNSHRTVIPRATARKRNLQDSDVIIKLKNRRLIGKYARWRCDRCGIEKEHVVSIFTRANGELMPTCGWACRKCGMRGRMVFQKLMGKGEEKK